MQYSWLMAIRPLRVILAVPWMACALSAQVVQTGGSCPAVLGPNSYQIFGSPVAGQSLSLYQTTVIGPIIHIKVIGFSNPASLLPSCGCTVQTSVEWVAGSTPVPTVIPVIGTSIVSLPLPPGSSGLVFYTQAFAVYTYSLPGRCTEFGPDFVTSPSYQVTIQ